MESITYLDNAATTRVCGQSRDIALEIMDKSFGNPSSLHALGVESSRVLAAARQRVAGLLGVEQRCVCFTSGGSEANNMAIFGAARAGGRRRKIVTTAVEHSSVSAACRFLEQNGYEVSYVQPDASGIVDAQSIADAVDENTALVSMMLVNNETGAIFPVEQAARLVKAKNPDTLFHCDAVQAFAKLPLRFKSLGVDLMSVSGHKLCAPKGVGALYIRQGVHIRPLIFGGGQEGSLRSGTENVPTIAAFGAACERLDGHIRQHYENAAALNGMLREKIEKIPGARINSPENSTPYIMNVSLPGYKSEILLHYLEQSGVYVSSGSACSKGAPSHVLAAMGLARDAADSALRVSLIYDTTAEDIERFASVLASAPSVLRK